MRFVRLFDLRLFGLSVSSSSLCLGWAAACDCDCGTPVTFLLPFFQKVYERQQKNGFVTVMISVYSNKTD